MRTARRPVLTTTALLALAVPLAACGSDDEEPESPAPITEDGTPASGDTGASPDAATDPTTAPTAGPTGEPTTDADAVPPAGADESGVFAAIELAEAELGGTAFEVDREDSPAGWEITVAVDNREVDVDVDQSGTEVLRTDDGDDLDDDDRAALDSAQVTLTDAIRTALDEAGGTLDDVTLDEEDGTVAWEVGLDDDVDVYVDVATGEVLRVDRD